MYWDSLIRPCKGSSFSTAWKLGLQMCSCFCWTSVELNQNDSINKNRSHDWVQRQLCVSCTFCSLLRVQHHLLPVFPHSWKNLWTDVREQRTLTQRGNCEMCILTLKKVSVTSDAVKDDLRVKCVSHTVSDRHKPAPTCVNLLFVAADKDLLLLMLKNNVCCYDFNTPRQQMSVCQG